MRARACVCVCVCVCAGYDNKDCPGQVTYSVGQVKISVACPTGKVVIGFFSFFLLTVSYFNSSIRFQVTVTVFASRFHNHQTDRLQCRSMRLACQCS